MSAKTTPAARTAPAAGDSAAIDPAAPGLGAPDRAGAAVEEEYADHDVSMLIRALGEVNRQLEDLTAGEVDTVTDRDGRAFLLQRGQERWRQIASDKQAAIIDALPTHIALLDAAGVIVSINEAWQRFGDANELCDPNYGVGRNYLDVCDQTRGEGALQAAQAAEGIRAVLGGASKTFSMEYPCNSPVEKRWFLLTATPADRRLSMGAVVMHLDITARKQNEEDLHRFAAAMDASPDGIFLIDRAEMRTVYVNEGAGRLHGMSRDEVVACEPWILLKMSRAALEDIYDAVILAGGHAPPEERLLQVGSATIWTEVRRHARRIGGSWTIVAVVRDVTARRTAEDRLARLNRMYAVQSGINALIVRAEGRNELFRGACRIAVHEGALAMAWIGMVDKNLGHVVPCASAGMPEEYLKAVTPPFQSAPCRPGDAVAAFVSNDSQHDPEIQFSALHAKYGINSMAKLPLMAGGEAAGLLVLYAREKGFFQEEPLRLLTDLAADVSFALQQIMKQERLDFLADFDETTGLANRGLFLSRALEHVHSAQEKGHELAICLLDLERFKNVNDSLGRAAGDSLLQQVGQWLTTQTGDSYLLARIDADRFALIMPKVQDRQEAAGRLEQTAEAFLKHSFTLNHTGYRIAAKIGVALYPADGAESDTLFKHAEVALKQAKARGDRYLFYTQKMTERASGRLDLENQLRRALERDEFVLHYQPKVAVLGGKLVGAEALIRWNDPHSGLVPPGRFIPILEETGLIQEVGIWALNQAMQDYLKWRSAGLPAVRIAVNLSAMQLRHRDFVATLHDVTGVAADAAAGLELEITESLIMEDIKLSITNLAAAREMGMRVSIDDFGTGFSSLSYLSKLPVDAVKIDRSFITDMVSGPEGLSFVSIIINLAHSLRLKVVAEGVETEEQARLLRLLGCDEMQGFLLSKPVPAETFADNFLVGAKPAPEAQRRR